MFMLMYCVCAIDSTFFGSIFEIYFDRTDTDGGGSLCAYGPTSEIKAEYVFGCFGGPKSGRSLTVFNKYSSGIKLCDVKLMGKYKALFLKILHCTLFFCSFISTVYVKSY